MNFEITPYKNVGCIILGMTRNEVRECFNNEYTEFKKTPKSETLTDDFGVCHVYYKKDDTCEAIEFFDPAEVTFNGEKLINQPYNLIKKIFKKLDSSIEFNDAGFTSFKNGIGIFAPYAEEEPFEPVEGVIVFEKGYYD